MNDSTEFIEGLLDETREELNRADSKASILVAALGIVIAVTGGAVLGGDVTLTGERLVVQVAGLASAASLLAGLALLGAAVYPSTGAAERGAARYYADFAQYDRPTDLQAALDSEARNLPDRHVRQLQTLSQIVCTKYRQIRRAIALTAIGLSAALGAVVLHAWLPA